MLSLTLSTYYRACPWPLAPRAGSSLLLAGLAVLLVAVVAVPGARRGGRRRPRAAPRPRGGTAAAGAKAAGSAPLAVPDVRLESLQAARPEPLSDRNLFSASSRRHRRRRRRLPRGRPSRRPTPNAPPPGPPPPPPITLKFIGVVQAGGRSQSPC